MPDLEKVRRHRRKTSLNEIVEHAPTVEGEFVPQGWKKVWARKEPENLEEITSSRSTLSIESEEGFAVFVVRFNPRWKLNDWIRDKLTAYRIKEISNINRWQVLTCKESEIPLPPKMKTT